MRILLETAAGQGSCVGHRFEHLRDILGAVRSPRRVAACLDTCHVHAAGYDIVTRKGYAETIAAFDRTVGLARLAAIHVNDSKKPRGSRVDRHEHIGRGTIGRRGFRNLMTDRRLALIPKFLETPKDDTLDHDRANLAVLRRLAASPSLKGECPGEGFRPARPPPPRRVRASRRVLDRGSTLLPRPLPGAADPYDASPAAFITVPWIVLQSAEALVPPGAFVVVRSEPVDAASDSDLHRFAVALLPGRRILPAARWGVPTDPAELFDAEYIVVVGPIPQPPPPGVLLLQIPEGSVWRKL